ncbi:MbtH family protein [Micromonospora sp. WMMD1082]|uniref:MbtH family protein n=1 Tax=Micromonospora sp. WMMD1082 TaxID=3016104 RepID=UPI002415A5AE|nr:MbtH family protein [Micromonospora sp. WMMD1082]MDG4794569.1 MbtH family protein [Micromonospora sp. WMMD1082]
MNPFDDPDGTFLVLANDDGQHSLWPAFADVPAGWRVVVAASDRKTCHDYVEREWADLRPPPPYQDGPVAAHRS